MRFAELFEEGQAKRPFDLALYANPGQGLAPTRSRVISHLLMTGTIYPNRILGSVLSYPMHSCTKGLCANPTNLFFQNPCLHSIQSLSFFLTISDL
jgi:hypothetical protein